MALSKYVMLAKIILTLFLIGIIVLFVVNASGTQEIEEDEPEDFNCIRPNPDDCTSYFNCLDAKIQCPLMERFDATSLRCRYFFEVSCGTRPNPPDPTSREICAPYHNGTLQGVAFFPLRNCKYFAHCDINRPNTLNSCFFNDNFSTVTNSCQFNVDCGRRCLDGFAGCERPL